MAAGQDLGAQEGESEAKKESFREKKAVKGCFCPFLTGSDYDSPLSHVALISSELR
jgi:hypothetical protein